MIIKLRRTEKQDTGREEDSEVCGFRGKFIINTECCQFEKTNNGLQILLNAVHGMSLFTFIDFDDLNSDIKNGYVEFIKEPSNDNDLGGLWYNFMNKTLPEGSK